MKRKIGGVLFGVVVLMASCAVAEEATPKVEAKAPEGFKVVSQQDIDGPDVVEIVHKKTGCHYLLSTWGSSTQGGPAMVQMYQSGGNGNVGTPYCEDVK